MTGAGKGIGKAIALRFALEGAVVVVNDIDQGMADGTALRILQGGGKALAIEADVRDRKQIIEMFREIRERYERIDILINNAGVRKDVRSHLMTDKQWDTTIDIDLKGCMNCTQAALKFMLKQNYGKIVNISSSLPPVFGDKGTASYSAANSGLYGLTQSLAVELGPYNINVNCIAPEFIDTDMTRSIARGEGLYLDDLKKFAVAAIPLRRLGKSAEVASLALFLVSDEAAFITGQVIRIKGGP